MGITLIIELRIWDYYVQIATLRPRHLVTKRDKANMETIESDNMDIDDGSFLDLYE